MTSPIPEAPEKAAAFFSESFLQIKNEIAKTVVGQKNVVDQLLISLFSRGHCVLVGVPGLAKTLLIQTLAKTLNLSFSRIQFTPDLMPGDITGTEVIEDDKETGKKAFKFIKGPIFANIVLADEINRTPPKTQAALLEGMQEYNVTASGQTFKLDRPFFVLATQNPIEQEGTYPLPEAQLDRFMFSLWMDYPPVEEEEDIVLATTAPRDIALEPVFSKQQLIAFQQLVRRIPVSRHVVSYAVAIARATRPTGPAASDIAQQYVEWGAGTRAGQYMILGGKAMAALSGSPTVSTSHIRQIAPYVLRHRVLPNYQAAGDGITVNDIMQKILEEIAEPTYAR